MAMNRVGSMLPQRDFLIVDEAHQLTEAMTGFSLRISQSKLLRCYNYQLTKMY